MKRKLLIGVLIRRSYGLFGPRGMRIGATMPTIPHRAEKTMIEMKYFSIISKYIFSPCFRDFAKAKRKRKNEKILKETLQFVTPNTKGDETI